MEQRIIIYQVLPRLFGNTIANCRPNGTKEENGVGKLNDFTPAALRSIKALGCTHVWYTGVIEHATKTDYSSFGIAPDPLAAVKGNAGSPYAIKDYYDIDPDLAVEVPRRMEEFEALVRRTHAEGLKLLIDFVPNHVARHYQSDAKPEGVEDFGATDDRTQRFDPDNNFYYLPGESLTLPTEITTHGDHYTEIPARATGNDCFSATPSMNDWVETVKLNYGRDYQYPSNSRFDPRPDTWGKMLDILLFWAGKGIDGFRCDMAEMVPCEFWHWAIGEVKKKHPAILFIAEVYNPAEYDRYTHFGRFDYLYDKVGLYDTLKEVIRWGQSASALTGCWQRLGTLQPRMLNFLENHDEQRLASDFFTGDVRQTLPLLLVSALLSSSPYMIYAGQELGERGMEAEGFSGRDGRTSIFDYWSVDTLRRWNNRGVFDLSGLTPEEKELRALYTRVLTLCNSEAALARGAMYDVMYANYDNDRFDGNKLFAFLRKCGRELCLVVANFSNETLSCEVKLPHHAFEWLGITPANLPWTDLLTDTVGQHALSPDHPIALILSPYGGVVLKTTL